MNKIVSFTVVNATDSFEFRATLLLSHWSQLRTRTRQKRRFEVTQIYSKSIPNGQNTTAQRKHLQLWSSTNDLSNPN